MDKHPQTLTETKLWQAYDKMLSERDNERRQWLIDIYDTAVEQLKLVPRTFPNYTLHDETHILNVIYAMGGLLGDHVLNLSINEVELLLLAAALHDIGMVYTDEDKADAFADERQCKRFINNVKPDLFGASPDEWPEEIQQRYLRDCHPFRVHKMLNHKVWRKLFEKRPKEIVSQETIVAVCQAHGEKPQSLRDNRKLGYDHINKVDPLFCALMLRLADLLDFDDTRTPEVLFEFATVSEKSIGEWKKHMAAQGFAYPEKPSSDELLYRAHCGTPGEEHAIREFLQWIDDELGHCRDLQRFCGNPWQQHFLFPRQISRKGITRSGYVSDRFSLTMDQSQIMKLLTGENLYKDNAVFVRELLQNAIDTTLLRGKMDPRFRVEEARIDLWEWTDPDGNILFRIDDQGCGMTLRMLNNYFLKVGNSYYTSREIKRDLRDHGSFEDFHGISRFGIGFLSCFLCGRSAEVSTLYFDEQKSESELEDASGSRQGYGLRMNVTGIEGYYVLQSQAENHLPDKDLPAPADMAHSGCPYRETNGYRTQPGTSIVIRLDPGKLGVINLKAAAEGALCGACMPVYYNGKRIGHTYDEIMSCAHEFAKAPLYYELTAQEKLEFDQSFPQIKGNYPKIAVSVFPLDTDEFRMLPNFSGVIMKHELLFEGSIQWEARDQLFELEYNYSLLPEYCSAFLFSSSNVRSNRPRFYDDWDDYTRKYGREAVESLKKAFADYSKCPESPVLLGDAWTPFNNTEDLYELWRLFVDREQYNHWYLPLTLERGIPTLQSLTGNSNAFGHLIAYQGIIAAVSDKFHASIVTAVFFLKDDLQPVVDIGRTKVTSLPIEALAAVSGIMEHPKLQEKNGILHWDNLELESELTTLGQWRELRDTPLGQWLIETQQGRLDLVEEYMRLPMSANASKQINMPHIGLRTNGYFFRSQDILTDFILSFFQDRYMLSVDYISGQVISFEERTEDGYDSRFALFPPMMFCKASNDKNRKYLCCDDANKRKCITQDHPFTEWLLDNAEALDQQFKRQFQQIVASLRNDDAKEIIEVVSGFRKQLDELRGRNITKLSLFDELNMDSFWLYKTSDGIND